MEKAEIMNSVVSVIASDGRIEDDEIKFLKKLCERLDISSSIVEEAFEKIAQGESYVALPQNEDEKKRLYSYLIEAVVADGVVAPEERALLETVAQRMGIPDQHVEHVLNIMLKRKAAESV